ncbi:MULTISPECIES: dihydropteroate synthase [unclassified Streptomyces]|uniref:dihydropteroate synthase n=1 Tax=unclassified Streptomyces TaxID=2593676 RepID=UPI0036B1D1F8
MSAHTTTVGPLEIHWGSRTYILAVINATPDSFSGDGVYATPAAEDAAVRLAAAALADGADVVDIGGVPTFPGAAPVPWDEELRRVTPIVTAITREVPVAVSVDTCQARVAEAALDAGAHMINSCWGLRTTDGGWNTDLAKVVAEREVPLVLTHNRASVSVTGPHGGYWLDPGYTDVFAEVMADLRAQLEYAREQGIAADRLIADFGLGMGKTPAQNLVLFENLAAMRELGAPALLSHSRKNFIGEVVGGTPAERDGATVALTGLGIAAGVDMLRIHNVALNKQAALMCDRLLRPVPPA